MKIVILNGSPRKNGNTFHALEAIKKGLLTRCSEADITMIRVAELSLKGCLACDGCKQNGGRCVINDGTARIMDIIADADVLIFGSPVYWWGISGQLKLLLDKFYSKDELFHRQKKLVGIVTVGAAGLEDPEFRLISEQFHCICDFLGWDLVLDEAVSAAGIDDLAGNAAKLAELQQAAEKIK